jgi:hypothetical protein
MPNVEYKIELETDEVITGVTTWDGETNYAFSKESSVGVKIYTREF